MIQNPTSKNREKTRYPKVFGFWHKNKSNSIFFSLCLILKIKFLRLKFSLSFINFVFDLQDNFFEIYDAFKDFF